MDEKEYLVRVEQVFRRVVDAFEDVEADVADVETSGDVVTISFADGSRSVLNTQRSVQQIWLAAGARAWHFAYDPSAARWLDHKGSGTELFDALRRLVRDRADLDLEF